MTRAPFVMPKSGDAVAQRQRHRLRHLARLALSERADEEAVPARGDGRDRREPRRELRASRARSRIASRSRSHQKAIAARRRGASPTSASPSTIAGAARARPIALRRRRRAARRHHAREAGAASSRCSARAARSPPATRRGSTTARRRCWCARRSARSKHGLEAARARRRRRGGGRRPALHGHRPGAGDARRRSRAPAGRSRDVELAELNEAFAVQVLAVLRELPIPRRARQRQRRRDRARPSARLLGRAHRRHAGPRDAPARRAARAGHDVHRRRAGHRRAVRSAVVDTRFENGKRSRPEERFQVLEEIGEGDDAAPGWRSAQADHAAHPARQAVRTPRTPTWSRSSRSSPAATRSSALAVDEVAARQRLERLDGCVGPMTIEQARALGGGGDHAAPQVGGAAAPAADGAAPAADGAVAGCRRCARLRKLPRLRGCAELLDGAQGAPAAAQGAPAVDGARGAPAADGAQVLAAGGARRASCRRCAKPIPTGMAGKVARPLEWSPATWSPQGLGLIPSWNSAGPRRRTGKPVQSVPGAERARRSRRRQAASRSGGDRRTTALADEIPPGILQASSQAFRRRRRRGRRRQLPHGVRSPERPERRRSSVPCTCTDGAARAVDVQGQPLHDGVRS